MKCAAAQMTGCSKKEWHQHEDRHDGISEARHKQKGASNWQHQHKRAPLLHELLIATFHFQIISDKMINPRTGQAAA